jgi:hypothetical protein
MVGSSLHASMYCSLQTYSQSLRLTTKCYQHLEVPAEASLIATTASKQVGLISPIIFTSDSQTVRAGMTGSISNRQRILEDFASLPPFIVEPNLGKYARFHLWSLYSYDHDSLFHQLRQQRFLPCNA